MVNRRMLPAACGSPGSPCALMLSSLLRRPCRDTVRKALTGRYLQCPYRARFTMPLQLDGHQIDHRKNEHPDQVHKVPVQAADLNVVGIELTPAIACGNDKHVDDADGDVRHVHAGNAKKGRSEQRHALRTCPKTVALAEQVKPLANVEDVEQDATKIG